MRDRARRTRTTAVVVVAALVGTTLVGALGGAFGGGSGARVEIPSEGPWTVVVAGDLTTVATCADDPSVSEAYVDSEDPTGRGAMSLADGARVDDVQRVVQCVSQGVDPERITVVRTPSAA